MSIRVAITDDHALFRSGLRALLEKEPDLEIVGEAGTGAVTLEILAREKPDVLLLDISMPGMCGSQVAELALKQLPGLAIVVLTMHEDEHYVQQMFRIGVRAFLLKKSTSTDLVHAIRVVSRGQQFVDPAMTECVTAGFAGRAARRPTAPDTLTAREREICTLLALGHTNTEISQKLFISERTVETHRSNIMTKLSLRTRAALVRFAIDHGLMNTSGTAYS